MQTSLAASIYGNFYVVGYHQVQQLAVWVLQKTPTCTGTETDNEHWLKFIYKCWWVSEDAIVSGTLLHYHATILFIIHRACREIQGQLQSVLERFPPQLSTGWDHLAMNSRSLHVVHWLADRTNHRTHADSCNATRTQLSTHKTIKWWPGGVVVRALDLRSIGRGFDSRPLHCQAMTLGKLFTPMCLCSPSSIIWYLARAFMLTSLYVAVIHGSNEQGEYCSSGSATILIA